MAAFLPPGPAVVPAKVVRVEATVRLVLEAGSPQEARNALIEFTRHGRAFDALEAVGARCVRWDGVAVKLPKAKRARKGGE